MFCHFGINTFYDQEWGDGSEDPGRFDPKSFDPRQWADVAKNAGFQYLILTAKHHDGFCLWPTATTDHSVKSSPWKDGKGDIVREVSDACREAGIGFGLYLSPWDRHEPCYGDKDAYDAFYCRQLTELLTGYGPLVEVWFDGAGSEGREYDWASIIALVDRYQPDAMVFNMGRPTIRWVGNEDGVAPYPCWNSVKTARLSMFTDSIATWLPDTPEWLPAECDVPIRKLHWFWHPEDEEQLKSLDDLKDIYYRSVGHGTNLLLNLSPDNRGLLPELDVRRVNELGDWIRVTFGQPAAAVSGVGASLLLPLEHERTLYHAVLMEELAGGERVKAFTLEARSGGEWTTIVSGTAIGHKKIQCLDAVQADCLRLTVTEAEDIPLIRQFSCF